jgi:hypothetical protein
VAGQTGLLVAPGDAMALRDALLTLARDRAVLHARSQRSVQAAQGMPWADVSRDYAESFRGAVAASSERRLSALLRRPFRPAIPAVQRLAHHFDADWWSFLVFHRGGQQAAFGRAAAYVDHPTHVAELVAQASEPVLLDRRAGSPWRPLLRRDDVSSAMAVPIPLRKGARGVLSLALGPSADRRYTAHDLSELARLIVA